ncbi:MAG: hypothetical protein JKX84_04245, partial [Flavobacteriales bacterium]|nr:hypothetical protein [Flavobacteriales bacterium]
MRRFQYILFTLAILVANTVSAQNELDALRYSQVNVLGTARYAAMGGAFGALGGDMTTLSVNPAGIGVFTKTTGTATIAILGTNTDATYLGTSTSDSRMNLNISNAGFVARFKRRKSEGKQWAWKSFSMGLTYNRTNSFNRRTVIAGVNTTSSVVDSWVNQLNNSATEYTDIPFDGVTPGGAFTDSYLGWNTFLIDTVRGTTNQYLRNVMPNYGGLQQVTETTKGSMGEVALSFGGNFGNVLYLGATVGIPSVNYRLERQYSESDAQDSIADFSSFTKTDYLNVSGRGFNIKFGAIYRPVKWLRLGAAIHSPTYYEMDEEFSAVLVSNLDGTQFNSSTMQGTYSYSLQTPFRAIGSLAFVIGKIGIVSADYEYVNYSMARFRSNDYSFSAENDNVKNSLSSAGNIRIGTEWRLGKISLRGGFAINGNPYTGEFNFDDTR